MVGDLEDVHVRQPFRHEARVHVVLGVAREEERAARRLAEEHDRGVVDRPAGVAGVGGHAAGLRPQHAEPHLAEAQVVARGERRPRRAVRERRVPRAPAGPLAPHSGLEHPPHAIALQDADQARHVVLVRVREHDEVDPAVPGRDLRVQLHEQAVRVRSTVDQQAAAVPALDQDGVALPYVQDDEARRAQRGIAQGQGGHGHHHERGAQQRAADGGPWHEARRRCTPRSLGCGPCSRWTALRL